MTTILLVIAYLLVGTLIAGVTIYLSSREIIDDYFKSVIIPIYFFWPICLVFFVLILPLFIATKIADYILENKKE